MKKEYQEEIDKGIEDIRASVETERKFFAYTSVMIKNNVEKIIDKIEKEIHLDYLYKLQAMEDRIKVLEDKSFRE